MFQLEKMGYAFITEQGFWSRSDYAGISYSDGDTAEERLLAAIRGTQDVSIFSPELKAQCHDWQTFYHLGSQRGNVLRPFGHLLKGKVLEIGAGCGAITRFLGENGGQILALEGSPRRAAIAAERTRDLSNVVVLAERFDDFKGDELFDAITLIGVLEYASLFSSDHESPALSMLKKAKSLLKPDGHLLIAIENQLGLKYFSGAPEDHLGITMYGLEDRYRKQQPQTYGKKALQKILSHAGYSRSEFLAPFPDYKVPKSIITEAGCIEDKFDAAALAWQTVYSDPQLPEITNFDLTRTWPVIFRNGLGLDLANSFIIVASPTATTPILPDSILAYHYSTDRQACYCKEAQFLRTQSGDIEVQYRRLSNEIDPENQDFRFQLPSGDKYQSGRLLSQDFIETLSEPGWKISDLAGLTRDYLRNLEIILRENGYPDLSLDDSSIKIPGSFIDALPHNIIIDSSGHPHLIDTEWAANGEISLGHLLCRGLLLLMSQACPTKYSAKIETLPRKTLIERTLKEANLSIDANAYDSYHQKELGIQRMVTGLNPELLDNWYPDLGQIASAKPQVSLYYGTLESGLSEERCVYRPFDTTRNVVRIELDEEFGILRLDPIDRSGWLIIHELAIYDSDQKLWSYDQDTPIISSAQIDCRVALPTGTLLYASDNDPQLFLPSFPDKKSLAVCLDVETLKEEEAYRLIQKAFQDKHSTFNAALQKLNEAEGDIKGLRQQLAAQEQRTLALSVSLDEIRNSTSWRLTRPLRLAGRLSRRALNAAQAARHLARQHGWRKLLERGLQVLRREGLRGVIARARQHRRLQMQQPLPATHLLKVTPAALGRDAAGHYQLARTGGYCYIPPARPDDLETRIGSIGNQPYFSIVVPVYNTPLDLLDKLLASVRDQWYPHWQLILADDKSPAEDIQAALASIDDPRIKVLRLEKNQGISGATNAAIEASDGDFIVFLDHDDELTADCLYEMALCIERDAPDFIYSDEDKLAEDGSYTQPHFKPDWSPDTMMSTMFTCHASCVRKGLLEKTGLLRSQFDGCQDWDFVLRVAEHTRRISHIPKVLYHWRIIPASVASDIAAKPYVLEASRQVRLDALRRRGLAGDVEPVTQVPGYFRVNYHLQGTPRISIIIPSRDNAEVLRRCLDSIRSQTTYANHEIILLDNGSVQPETLAYLESQKQQEGTQVIRHDAPFNFSELNNLGVRHARGDLLLFLNDDTEVLCPDWLERMGGYAQLPHVAAVGAKLLYPDNKGIQHAGVLNLANGPVHAFLHHDSEVPAYFMRNMLEYNWMAVTGACLMMERSKFDTLGGFDESFPVAYNDIELCFRGIEHGYFNVVCQAVTLVHHESVSRGLDQIDPAKLARLQNELARLYQKHPQYFQYDPFHNPNLHPSGLNFEVPA